MKSINTKSLQLIAGVLKKRVKQWKYYLPMINLAFFAGVAVLGIICVLQVCNPPEDTLKPEQYKEKLPGKEKPLPSDKEARAIDYYEPMVSSNPFSPNRIAWVSPEEKKNLKNTIIEKDDDEDEEEVAQITKDRETQQKPRGAPAKITLQGILILGNTKKALIENPDKTGNKKAFIFVEEGEEIAEYKVTHIGADLIKLDWYGEEQVVAMRPNLIH